VFPGVFRMPLWRPLGAARFRRAGHDRAATRPRPDHGHQAPGLKPICWRARPVPAASRSGPGAVPGVTSAAGRWPDACRTLAGCLPDACRTHWIRDSTALERSGSGVSSCSNWPGAYEPWCWWC